MIDNTAVVQQAEETEEVLVQRARSAEGQAAWVIGECASRWHVAFAKGRMDKDFGALIDLTGDQVNQRRVVWEKFGATGARNRWFNLSWSHFREATYWDDADECLAFAHENQATVKEMIIWRKLQRGELQKEILKPFERQDVPTRPVVKREREASPRVPVSASRNETGGEESGGTEPSALEGSVAASPEEQPVVESEKKDKEKAAEAMEAAKLYINTVLRYGTAQQKDSLANFMLKFIGRVQEKERARDQEVTDTSKELRQLWNDLPGFITCESFGPKRRQALSARLKEEYWRDHWKEALTRIRGNPWMQGDNESGWKAHVEWFLRPETVPKIMEGRYRGLKKHNRSKAEERTDANRRAFDALLGERATEDDAVF